MATYRFIPHRDLRQADDLACSFEAQDDKAARLEGFERFVKLPPEIKSAALYDHQGTKIDTWGRS